MRAREETREIARSIGVARANGRPPGSETMRAAARTVIQGDPRRWPDYQRLAISFGHRLRDLRKEAQISARTLAHAISVSELTIYNWERGAVPSIAMLLAIATALGCSLVDLLPDEAHDVR